MRAMGNRRAGIRGVPFVDVGWLFENAHRESGLRKVGCWSTPTLFLRAGSDPQHATAPSKTTVFRGGGAIGSRGGAGLHGFSSGYFGKIMDNNTARILDAEHSKISQTFFERMPIPGMAATCRKQLTGSVRQMHRRRLRDGHLFCSHP
jgi:hypothetical protein